MIIPKPYRGSGRLRTRWISAGLKMLRKMSASVIVPAELDELELPERLLLLFELPLLLLLFLAISSAMHLVVLCVGSSKTKATCLNWPRRRGS